MKRIILPLSMMLTVLLVGGIASGQEMIPPEKANMNWQQFAGAEITVLDIAHATGMTINRYIEEFEKLTGIKVNHLIMDEDKMREKRTADLAAKRGRYDAFEVGLTIVPQYFKAKWVENLVPFVNDPALTDQAFYQFEGLSPPLVEANKQGDYLCAIPNMFGAPIFFYRTDILAESGLGIPQSWDRLANSFMPKMQTFLDSKGYRMSAFVTRGEKGAGANTWTLGACFRSFGVEWFDKNMKPLFNSPEAVEALTTYVKFCDPANGAPPGVEGFGMYDITELFYLDKVATVWMANDRNIQLENPEMSKIVGKWDTTIPPAGPVKRTTSLWTWAYGINPYSANKEAAWLFIQWVTSPYFQAKVGADIPPSRTDLLGTKPFEELRYQNWVEANFWVLQFGDPASQPLIPEFPEWGEYFGTECAKAIARIKDPKAALDAAVEQVSEVMKKAGYYK